MKLMTACLMTAFLFLDSKGAIVRAREAMTLWAEAVAPAMFPFLVLTPVFTDEENRRLYARAFGSIMKKVFYLPAGAASCVIVGIISGTPAGAIAVRRALGREAFTVKQAHVCLHLSSGVGPVFCICSVGQGMFSDAWAGVRMYISAWMAQMISGFILSRMPVSDRDLAVYGEKNNESVSAVRDGVINILTVCGWMAAFNVFAGRLPKPLFAFFEVSGGAKYASGFNGYNFASAVCAFGGLCAIFQSLSACRIREIRRSVFIAFKVLSGVLAYGVSYLLNVFSGISVDFSPDAFYVSSSASLLLALPVLIYAGRISFKNKGKRQNDKAQTGC